MIEEKTDVKEPVLTGDAVELLQKIQDRVDEIKTNRAVFEKQWLINIAFLYGKHYFEIEKRPLSGLDERIHWELKNLERKKKTRRVANYILPLYRSLLARMLMLKAQVSAEPTTASQRDKDSARIAQEVLEDFWQMANKRNPQLCLESGSMLLVLKRLFEYMLTLGTGYLKPYFNPNTNAKTVLGNEVIEGEIGEVEVQVLSPFDVFVDPLNRFVIEQKIMSVEDIEKQYGKKVKGEDIGMSEVEQQLLTLLHHSKDENYENCARVYEMWERGAPDNQGGQHTVATKTMVMIDEDIPLEYKGIIPYFEFRYLDLVMSRYAQSFVEQLISLQEEYNFTVTRLAEYKKWMAGKLLVPDKCKLETKYDDEVGQIVHYRSGFGVPQWQVPPSPPVFLMDEIMRIRRDMEDGAGVHDTSLGRIPQQVKSGVAIENLSESDNSQLAPILISIEEKLEHFCEMVLNIVEVRYTEPRLLSITGDTMGAEIKSFLGTNVRGNKRIKISLGSAMPVSREARQALILGLADKGYITKQKAMETLEFADLESMYHPVDETQSKSENQELSRNILIEPQQWEDHTVHLKEHTNYMKSEQFRTASPDIRGLFIAHIEKHQEFLRGEMQAMATMAIQPAPSKPQEGAL